MRRCVQARAPGWRQVQVHSLIVVQVPGTLHRAGGQLNRQPVIGHRNPGREDSVGGRVSQFVGDVREVRLFGARSDRGFDGLHQVEVVGCGR